jgi:hypothetical protein
MKEYPMREWMTLSNKRKGQFWNLWMLVSFMIVLMLFVWYLLSSAVDMQLTEAGESAAQVYSLYHEKERIVMFLNEAIDFAAREAVKEIALSLPGSCGNSITGRPVLEEGSNCIMTDEDMAKEYTAIVERKLNEITASYPNTMLPHFSVTHDFSAIDGGGIIAYSQTKALIQPPVSVIYFANSKEFPTMITHLSAIRQIPDSFYDIAALAEGINNIAAAESDAMREAIERSLSSPNNYCESDAFAHDKFLSDIAAIITHCPAAVEQPCLCGELMPPIDLTAREHFLVFDNGNGRFGISRKETLSEGDIVALMSGLGKYSEGLAIPSIPGQVTLTYSRIESSLYIYYFPRRGDVNINLQGKDPVELYMDDEGMAIASPGHLMGDGKTIPYCSSLIDEARYKVNIFVWDADPEMLRELKEAQGSRSPNYALFALSSHISDAGKKAVVDGNLIDPGKMISDYGGKALNVFILPSESMFNRLKMSSSTHFETLPGYIDGFIRMDEEIFYSPPQAVDTECMFACNEIGGTYEECASICIAGCPDIKRTPRILSASERYIVGGGNPGATDEYRSVFGTAANIDNPYPYLAIYYPDEISLDCMPEPLDTSSEEDIDKNAFIESIVKSVMMGMNAYFSAPKQGVDACIDYPIKELLYNNNKLTYRIENIYAHVTVPKKTDNIWPIELGRITQCFGEVPLSGELRYTRHIGFDMQPPGPRVGYGQELNDHFPEGFVRASFSGLVVEYAECISGVDGPCTQIQYHKAEDDMSGYNSPIPRYYDNPENGYGEYMVVKDHHRNLYAVYAHLKPGSLQLRDDTGVARIFRVNKGDIIGLVGNTGYSTGAHLHFEIYSMQSGNKVRHNPLCFLPKAIDAGGSPKDISGFFPVAGTPIETEYRRVDGEEDNDWDENDMGLSLPDRGWAYNCYVNYYDSYFGTGIQDVCPSIT